MTERDVSSDCPRCGSPALNWRKVFVRGERIEGEVELECRHCGFAWTELLSDRKPLEKNDECKNG